MPPPVPTDFDNPEDELRALDAAIIEDLQETIELERRKAELREEILEIRPLSDHALHYSELIRRVEGLDAALAGAMPNLERAQRTVVEARRLGEQAR